MRVQRSHCPLSRLRERVESAKREPGEGSTSAPLSRLAHIRSLGTLSLKGRGESSKWEEEKFAQIRVFPRSFFVNFRGLYSALPGQPGYGNKRPS